MRPFDTSKDAHSYEEQEHEILFTLIKRFSKVIHQKCQNVILDLTLFISNFPKNKPFKFYFQEFKVIINFSINIRFHCILPVPRPTDSHRPTA
jgi:hypothetical protein